MLMDMSVTSLSTPQLPLSFKVTSHSSGLACGCTQDIDAM